MTCERLEREDMLGHLGEQMPPHVEECPDCRTRLAQYTRLAAALEAESSRPLPAGWKERTLERLEPERILERQQAARRRRRAALAAGLACAGAIAVILVLVLRPPAPRGQSDLGVNVEGGMKEWRGQQYHPGDFISVPPLSMSGPNREVRIYRNAKEVLVRCPGDAGCRLVDGQFELRWSIPTVGTYQIVWLASSSQLPPPTGDLDADVHAAQEAGAQVREAKPIHVD